MYTREEFSELISRGISGLSYNDEAERLTEPVKYILSLGGKRLRPMITLMSCNLFTDKPERALMPALGLEVFHNFTLVHDDIMDNAPLRRGFATVHEKWNLNQAILSGDVMAFIANECLLQAPPESVIQVFRLYNRTATEVCIGQQLDMEYERRPFVSLMEYMRMIELKTAVLIAACMKTGAIVGGASDRDADLMYESGRNLGLAFQIQDDLLDVFSDPGSFGKKTGGDIVSNKKTLLLIKALETASGSTLRRLQELISLREFDPDLKIAEVKAIYDSLGIKQISEEMAGEHIGRAFGYLGDVSVSPERKEGLLQLVSALIGRTV